MATAVLVHGMGCSPADWRWVAEGLEDRGVEVRIPDLPSHRGPEAHRSDDVREVEAAIRSASPPVAVAGWSYGGWVVQGLAAMEGIRRFIYIACFPKPPGGEPLDLDNNPHALYPDEATVVTDNDWWLATEEVAGFPDKVRRHLREHPRRPSAKAAIAEPPEGEAWRSVPTTILRARGDPRLTIEGYEDWLRSNFDDVRVVDGGHFLPLTRPQVVADVIAETFVTPS